MSHCAFQASQGNPAIGVATIGPGEYSLDHALCLIEDLDGVTG